MRAHLLCVLTGLSFSACLRPAQERAERDERVGRASSQGLEVRIAQGLAAVRQLGPERVQLWQSAPAIELTLQTPEDGQAHEVELLIENCTPGSELIALNDPAVITALPTQHPTECRWQLAFNGGSLDLRHAAPGAETPGRFQFGVLSDVQEALFKLSDIFERLNAEPGLDFLLGCGDLTRRGSSDELELFQATLKQLLIPYYTTLGNHELGQVPTLYHDYFGRGNFQFWHKGVAFTLLDSASATLDPITYEWLAEWLAGARASVHVVGMHVPPLDPVGIRNGAFAHRGEAGLVLNQLAAASVDLTLYGHIHTYIQFQNAGIPAHVSGGGGAIPQKFDGIGRHFMVVDIDAERGVLGTRVVEVGG